MTENDETSPAHVKEAVGTERTGRRVVAWASVSMDGYTSGPGGPEHDQWLYEHSGQEQTIAYFEGIWRGASTALLGRKNYEGFCAVWPGITRDPGTPARMRDLGAWIEAVEKVVFSTTLTATEWENSRLAAQPLEAEVKALKEQPGRDIFVMNSASIIHQLLQADLVDDLRLAIVPTVVGGGLRLLPDGLPASKWELAETTTLAHGAVCLHYRRP
jgi:dihydrofolate reductase